jgi:large subunit ribosomal protein L18
MRKSYKTFNTEGARLIQKRKLRIRKKLLGTSERPRLCVNITNRNYFIQLIDDEKSKTLASFYTFGKKATVKGSNSNATVAKELGTEVGKKIKSMGVGKIVFDRNGRLYSGKLEAIASEIRAAGISF